MPNARFFHLTFNFDPIEEVYDFLTTFDWRENSISGWKWWAEVAPTTNKRHVHLAVQLNGQVNKKSIGWVKELFSPYAPNVQGNDDSNYITNVLNYDEKPIGSHCRDPLYPEVQKGGKFRGVATDGKPQATLDEFIADATSGKKSRRELAMQYGKLLYRNPKGFGAVIDSVAEMGVMEERPWVITLEGVTGVGKTMLVRRIINELNLSSTWKPSDRWWLQWDGEEVLVIDDMTGKQMHFEELNNLLDAVPVLKPYKGGFTACKPKVVFITTNVPCEEWWPNNNERQKAATARRIKNGNGVYYNIDCQQDMDNINKEQLLDSIRLALRLPRPTEAESPPPPTPSLVRQEARRGPPTPAPIPSLELQAWAAELMAQPSQWSQKTQPPLFD